MFFSVTEFMYFVENNRAQNTNTAYKNNILRRFLNLPPKKIMGPPKDTDILEKTGILNFPMFQPFLDSPFSFNIDTLATKLVFEYGKDNPNVIGGPFGLNRPRTMEFDGFLHDAGLITRAIVHHCQHCLGERGEELVVEQFGPVTDRQKRVEVSICNDPILGEIKLGGLIDGLIEDGKTLVEIKTRRFGMLQGMDMVKVKIQCHIYMAGLGIQNAQVWCLNLETMILTKIKVLWDEAFWQREIVLRLQHVIIPFMVCGMLDFDE
jgi:hypothetical protein